MIVKNLNEDKRSITLMQGRYAQVGGQRGRLFIQKKTEVSKKENNEPSKV